MSEEHRFAGNGSVRRYITLFVWLMVALAFFSLAWQWIVLTSSDRQLTDYAESVLQRSALDRRSPKDVRTLLVVKAEQLAIPLQEDGITVAGEPGRLRASIAYNKDLTIPLLGRALYRMHFSHILSSPDWR